ncbi:MAG TPA: SBBP repeat-containing protein, partial [Vicinamibacterales bacterium]|nr:SBBP repeat-containing protein [Vicinamibacterales bacterium]
MRTCVRWILASAAICAITASAAPGAAFHPLGSLPLAFERNEGQLDERVRYVARGSGFEVFFTLDAARIVKRDGAGASVVDIRPGGGRSAAPEAGEPLPQRTNYFRGEQASDSFVDIGNFGRITYPSVYSGVDLVYYGTHGELEYDFVVAPHADPKQIRLVFEGTTGIRVSDDGRLILDTPTGILEFRKPVAYQDIGGRRHHVVARYALDSEQVLFALGEYDATRPLVIDPILSLSTNLWGNTQGVALDAAGNIYVVGSTWTSGLPTSAGYQTQLAGTQDAYVAKLNPAGTNVIYATYLGARRVTTIGLGIAVDGAGSAYVTGTTARGYPITPGAYLASGTTFVTKLNPAGNGLAYSTFVTSPVASLAVDGAGNAYMTGTATALSTTSGVFQQAKIGTSAPYVAKLAASGASMVYATYLGGSANDDGKRIAVDAAGNAYVVGVARSLDFPAQNALSYALAGASDAFVAKLNPTGSALVYSTYLGGSGNERGLGIAVDASGQAYVTGWTTSTNFPVTPSAFQRTIGYPDPAISNAFITKLDATGNGLRYSSYLGGKWCFAPGVYQCFGLFYPDEGIDVGTAVAVDAGGYAYVGGYVTSTLFPLVDSIQSAVTPADADVWHVPLVAKVAPDGDR